MHLISSLLVYHMASNLVQYYLISTFWHSPVISDKYSIYYYIYNLYNINLVLQTTQSFTVKCESSYIIALCKYIMHYWSDNWKLPRKSKYFIVPTLYRCRDWRISQINASKSIGDIIFSQHFKFNNERYTLITVTKIPLCNID